MIEKYRIKFLDSKTDNQENLFFLEYDKGNIIVFAYSVGFFEYEYVIFSKEELSYYERCNIMYKSFPIRYDFNYIKHIFIESVKCPLFIYIKLILDDLEVKSVKEHNDKLYRDIQYMRKYIKEYK